MRGTAWSSFTHYLWELLSLGARVITEIYFVTPRVVVVYSLPTSYARTVHVESENLSLPKVVLTERAFCDGPAHFR